MAENELRDIVAVIRSCLVLYQEVTLTILEHEYHRSERTNIPYWKYGYDKLVQFLQMEVGCVIRETTIGTFVSYTSEKSTHMKKFVKEQKAQHKPYSNVWQGELECAPRPVQYNRCESNNGLPYNGSQITRDDSNSSSFCRRLTMGGAGPLSFPTQRTLPVSDDASYRALASSLSTILPPKSTRCSVIDVIGMLAKVNKHFAGRELSLDEYLDYVERQNGTGPISYMRLRYSTTERIMDFIALNSQQQYQVEVTQRGRLRIGGLPLESEITNKQMTADNRTNGNDTNVHNTNSSNGNNNKRNSNTMTASKSLTKDPEIHRFLWDIPYSTAFNHILVPIDREAKVIIGLFTAGRQLRTSFTTESDAVRRDDLLKRLNDDNILRQARVPGQVYQGMPCLALDDVASKGVRQYHRAVVVNKTNEKVKLYFVDYGSIAEGDVEELREIPASFLEESVYSHPAVVAHVKPPQQQQNFPKCIEQHLSVYEEDTIVIRILSHEPPYHEVDLKELINPLIEKGLIDQDTIRGSFETPAEQEVSYTVEVKMLPNMHNIFIVTYEREECHEVLVPTACLSALLSLDTDSLLSDLQTAIGITASAVRYLKRSVNDKLYYDLSEMNCPLLKPNQPISLVSISAVVPLLKAHEGVYTLPQVLPCARATYKFLKSLVLKLNGNNKHQ